MSCLSCQERAKLLKAALAALYAGDRDSHARLMQSFWQTVKTDIKSAVTDNPKPNQ